MFDLAGRLGFGVRDWPAAARWLAAATATATVASTMPRTATPSHHLSRVLPSILSEMFGIMAGYSTDRVQVALRRLKAQQGAVPRDAKGAPMPNC